MTYLSDQLALDIGMSPAPTLDNFVVGENEELVRFLKQMRSSAEPQFCYLWGPAGAGKTHLAQAFAPLSEAVPEFDTGVRFYSVDAVDTLSETSLDSLFKLINDIRAHPGTALLMTGRHSPAQRFVRDDILSRLTWGPVFTVKPLQGEVWEVVLAQAKARGMEVTLEARKWMQAYLPSDIKMLSAVIEAMDRELLVRKRGAVTVPLIREWLAKREIEVDENVFELKP
ncbi:MAG TPA: DnaA regulatory inactivator Hda [Sutterella sp.]|nr:DnaA regulatory inactivator Hda [Sutterella sp.]